MFGPKTYDLLNFRPQEAEEKQDAHKSVISRYQNMHVFVIF